MTNEPLIPGQTRQKRADLNRGCRAAEERFRLALSTKRTRNLISLRCSVSALVYQDHFDEDCKNDIYS